VVGIAHCLQGFIFDHAVVPVSLVASMVVCHILSEVHEFSIELGETELVAVETRVKLTRSVHVAELGVEVEIGEHVGTFLI